MINPSVERKMDQNEFKVPLQHRFILKKIAHKVMTEKGLLTDFSEEALYQLSRIEKKSINFDKTLIDLRHLPWCSIDNDDSKDLDQITFAQKTSENIVKVLVAISDVDALVKKGSSIDEHARENTTTVYTAAELFPMLPEKLSNNLTSLNVNKDRQALVTEMNVNQNGEITHSFIYQAIVHNYAQLTYNNVANWLENKAELSFKDKGIEDSLRLQDRVAQQFRKTRYKNGALNLETIQTRPIFMNNTIKKLEVDRKNRAKELIEDLMIASNTISAQFLKAQGLPSLRRVVREPSRWERIVEEARKHDYELPLTPNSESLAQFLNIERQKNPQTFPDLSLTIIKLIGKGEYIVEMPHEESTGHFGLAVMDYTHSTAPNRRFPDLITQRMLKAILVNGPNAYQNDELDYLAQHCTQREDIVNKIERRVAKSAAALLLSSKVGDTFNAICTGASYKGTWVRIFNPPIEGKLVSGTSNVDVGDRLKVILIYIDVENGYIDFKRT